MMYFEPDIQDDMLKRKFPCFDLLIQELYDYFVNDIVNG